MMRIICVTVLVLLAGTPFSAQKGRRVAITIDDLPATRPQDIEQTERLTRDLVGALVRHKVPAIGFVNEQKLEANGRTDPRRVALLQRWIDAGLELGNHTYSHPDLHKIPIEEFERNVVAGEKVTRELLRKAGKEIRYFRHPFLHTGRDRETRDRLHQFLHARGYRVAPVSIDNNEYIFAAAYDRATEAERPKIAASYLEYMERVVAFYEQQSVAIVGREIAQTLLIHANTLNAATFDDLAEMLRRRGYAFISLDEALKDAAYQSPDSYFGPAGITWLHRWAMTAGMPSSTFKGEPTVPEWIERAAKILGAP